MNKPISDSELKPNFDEMFDFQIGNAGSSSITNNSSSSHSPHRVESDVQDHAQVDDPLASSSCPATSSPPELSSSNIVSTSLDENYEESPVDVSFNSISNNSLLSESEEYDHSAYL